MIVFAQWFTRFFSYFLLALIIVSCGRQSNKYDSNVPAGETAAAYSSYYGSGMNISEVLRMAHLWGDHKIVLAPDTELCRSSLTLTSLAPFCTKVGAAASRLSEPGMIDTLDRLNETSLGELHAVLQRFN